MEAESLFSFINHKRLENQSSFWISNIMMLQKKMTFLRFRFFMHAHHCRIDISLTIYFRDLTRPPTLHKIITERNQFINTFNNWMKRMDDIQVYALQHFFARSLTKDHVRFNIPLQSTRVQQERITLYNFWKIICLHYLCEYL